MKKDTLGMWIVRLIFCIFVILAYNTINNFGMIISWFGKILGFLTPFIIGGVIAFLLFPICKKLETLLLKTKKKFIVKRVRGIATLIIVLLALLIVGLIILLMSPIVYNSIVTFIQSVPKYLNEIQAFIHNNLNSAGPLAKIAENIQNALSVDNITKTFVSSDYNSYVYGITSLFFGIFNLLIGAIISIYLLLDRKFIKETAVRIARVIFQDNTIKRIGRLSRRISKVIYTFIFGQVIDAFVVSCFMGMFLTIFGIDNSVVLALFYFFCAVIPYFGSMIGVCLVAILSLMAGDMNQFFIAIIIAIVLQQLDANFISPKIVGQAVGIGPLYVILGITLFGGILGIYGLFLGPPLMAICMELIDEFISNKEEERNKNMECLKDIGILSKIKNQIDPNHNSDDSNDKLNKDK